MKIAVFDTNVEAETWAQFDRNIKIKTNPDGSRYFTTKANSCAYGQYFNKDVSFAEARKRFVDFYYPLAVEDAKRIEEE